MAAVFLSLAIFVVAHECFRKKLIAFDFLSIFALFFLISYLLPAIFWAFDTDGAIWGRYYFGAEVGLTWVVWIALLISYLSVIFGYKIGGALHVAKRYCLSAGTLRLGRVAVFLYAILLVAVFLFIVFYSGGYSSFIAVGIASRQGDASLGFAGYLRYGLVFSELLFVLVLASIMEKRDYLLAILGACVFFVAVSVAISSGGRSALIYVILIPLVFFIVRRGYRVNWASGFLLVLALFIGPLIVLAGRGVLADLRSGEFEISALYQLIAPVINDGFSGYIAAWAAIFSYYKHYLITIGLVVEAPSVYEVPRLGLDYVRAFVAVVPGVSGVAGDVDFGWITSVPAAINRDFVGGVGYVPPGWVAFALMNGGVGWLALHGFFSGLIGGLLNSWVFQANKELGSFKLGIGVVFMFGWHRVFFAQDPWDVVLGSLGVLILCLLVILGFSVRLKKIG